MRLLAFGLVVFVALQLPADWRPISLRAGEASFSADACRWDATAPFRRIADGHIEVLCDVPGTTALLQCDPAGVEPRDLRAADLCAAPVVEFDPAKTTIVSPTAPKNTRVTWLRGMDKSNLDVRATRTFTGADPFTIVTTAGGLVRFAPQSASPMTLLGSTLTSHAGFVLRTDAPGGELFARTQPATMMPQTLEVLAANRTTPLTFRSPWVSLPALDPGLYSVTRIYAGGVRTSPVPVSVIASRTADLFLPAERVGGVRVRMDPSVCVPESHLELHAVDGLQTKPVASAPMRDCQWTVGGLAPGRYLARAVADPVVGVPAEAEVVVTAQSWSEIELIPAPVIVRGRVMILGYPAAQKDVRFANKLYPANTVTLDDDGRYVVGLPAAGTYEISLDAAPLGMRTYTAGYHAGENHYDLEINGALLRVRLTQDGDVPKEPVLVRVRGPRDPIQQLVTTFDKLFEIDGLPFGVYVVSASTTSGLVSLDQTVVLNDKLSSATVWLDVSHERRALHVETDNGTAVKQATIYAEGGSQTLQVPTGLFPLPPLPLRTRIIVTAPDLAPTCIVVTGATEEQATLVTHTANVELRFLRIAGQPGVASGDLFGINGATCGVPLEHVSGQLVSRGEYDAIIVKLPVGQLQIDHNGTRTIFDVPGPPVVVK